MAQWTTVGLTNSKSSFLLIERRSTCHFFTFGRLLDQFLVDMFVKMEGQRLNFIRSNQKRLLNRAIYKEPSQVKMFLPASFVGGRPYIHQKYLDAIALMVKYGRPSLFITMTANPQWPELLAVLDGVPATERKMDVVRVFWLKMNALIDELKTSKVFGAVDAYVAVIEFQQRGLPHCHILLWLTDACKPKTAADVDAMISAEIPRINDDPHLHGLVTKFMIHRHVGDNPPCFRNGQCRYSFPKPMSAQTVFVDGHETIYQRRPQYNQPGSQHLNSWVATYNPYLLKRFNCHINVAVVDSYQAIKYLFKYFFKSPESVVVERTRQQQPAAPTTVSVSTAPAAGGSSGETAAPPSQDMLKDHVESRLVSAPEAALRLLGKTLYFQYPKVQRLAVHHEIDAQRGSIVEDVADLEEMTEEELQEMLESRTAKQTKTTLTEWMEHNKMKGTGLALTYAEFVDKFTWNKATKEWTERKQKSRTIGRLHYVAPERRQMFALRQLLMHQRGCKSWSDIKRVGSVVYPTFTEAAAALLGDRDSNLEMAVVAEAAEWQMPQQLRRTFAIILLHTDCNNPFEIWQRFKKDMSEDFDTSHSLTPAMRALIEIDNFLKVHHKRLSMYDGFPIVPEQNVPSNTENMICREHQAAILARMRPNPEQQEVIDIIVEELQSSRVDKRQFYISGSAGCGKTFVYQYLLAYCRSRGMRAIAVASTGIAATLLEGGQTAHSAFQIPVPLTSRDIMALRPDSSVGQSIINSDIIIWDEISMISSAILEYVDNCFKLLMKTVNDDCKDMPFGGKLTVFGGDFKQTLPVLKRQSSFAALSAALPGKTIWNSVHRFCLITNMRILDDNDLLRRNWLSLLHKVGNPDSSTPPSHLIEIPISLCMPARDIMLWLSKVFVSYHGSFLSTNCKRHVLCPTNEQAFEMNQLSLRLISGDSRVYLSQDELHEEYWNIPVEEKHMNNVETSSLPPHRLELKVGAPLMLLRNLDQANGLCNGQLLELIHMSANVLKVKIIHGKFAETVHFIPRIPLHSDISDNFFIFTRRQFPVRLAFAMTINKSQGQTFDYVGLDLRTSVFGHGQLYVALSRVRSAKKISILIPDDQISRNGSETIWINNFQFANL